MLLREVLFSKLDLEEAKSDGPKDVLGKTKFCFAIPDTPNQNKRVYRKALLTTAIASLQKQIEEDKTAWGSPEHPEGSAVVKIQDISHRLSRVWLDEKGQAWAEAEILNTSKGKDLAVILRKGKVGVSLRAEGTTTETNGLNYVNDDLNIRGVDFVMNQSFEQATAQGLYESAEIPAETDDDAEVEEFLATATEEELEELDKLASMTDEEADEYLAQLEKDEQIVNPPSLTEEFMSLDRLVRDAVKATFGEAAWVKDFSQDEIVLTIPNPGSPDALVKLSYKLSNDGIEFTSDPVLVNKVEDYEEISEQSLKNVVQKEQKLNENNPDLKAGELSEQEMKLSGYTKRFCPDYLKAGELSEEEMRNSGHPRRFAAPDLKLSEEENRGALSDRERKLLREKDEK